jgi:hypothetical protein
VTDTIAITPRGPFSLAASGGFLEDFTPAMADAYHLHDPSPEELAELSTRWAPYRSWVALLLRAQFQNSRP